VKKSSKVDFTLPREEIRERLVHRHFTGTSIATFETTLIRRSCFVSVTRLSRWHHGELDDDFGRPIAVLSGLDNSNTHARARTRHDLR
jgi:hypothetical protein